MGWKICKRLPDDGRAREEKTSITVLCPPYIILPQDSWIILRGLSVIRLLKYSCIQKDCRYLFRKKSNTYKTDEGDRNTQTACCANIVRLLSFSRSLIGCNGIWTVLQLAGRIRTNQNCLFTSWRARNSNHYTAVWCINVCVCVLVYCSVYGWLFY